MRTDIFHCLSLSAISVLFLLVNWLGESLWFLKIIGKVRFLHLYSFTKPKADNGRQENAMFLIQKAATFPLKSFFPSVKKIK